MVLRRFGGARGRGGVFRGCGGTRVRGSFSRSEECGVRSEISFGLRTILTPRSTLLAPRKTTITILVPPYLRTLVPTKDFRTLAPSRHRTSCLFFPRSQLFVLFPEGLLGTQQLLVLLEERPDIAFLPQITLQNEKQGDGRQHGHGHDNGQQTEHAEPVGPFRLHLCADLLYLLEEARAVHLLQVAAADKGILQFQVFVVAAVGPLRVAHAEVEIRERLVCVDQDVVGIVACSLPDDGVQTVDGFPALSHDDEQVGHLAACHQLHALTVGYGLVCQGKHLAVGRHCFFVASLMKRLKPPDHAARVAQQRDGVGNVEMLESADVAGHHSDGVFFHRCHVEHAIHHHVPLLHADGLAEGTPQVVHDEGLVLPVGDILVVEVVERADIQIRTGQQVGQVSAACHLHRARKLSVGFLHVRIIGDVEIAYAVEGLGILPQPFRRKVILVLQAVGYQSEADHRAVLAVVCREVGCAAPQQRVCRESGQAQVGGLVIAATSGENSL